MLIASPASANWIGKATKSKEDFQTAFLSLPGDGWIGAAPPVPSVDMLCSTVRPIALNAGTIYEIPEIPCRITGKIAASAILELVEGQTNLIDNPQELTFFVKELQEALPLAHLFFRNHLFLEEPIVTASPLDFVISPAYADDGVGVGKPSVFKALAGIMRVFKHGAKDLKHFLTGKMNSRVDPGLALGAMYYLVSRMDMPYSGTWCSDCKAPGNADSINRTILKNAAIVMKAITGVKQLTELDLNQNRELVCNIEKDSHGAMFELLLAAYYHALYEFMDKNEYAILELDNSVNVSFYDNNGVFREITRRPDLQLKGSSGLPIWIEAKSVQAYTTDWYLKNKTRFEEQEKRALRRWPNWRVRKKSEDKAKMHYHRQFLTDMVAATEIQNAAGKELQHLAEESIWWVQSWKGGDALEPVTIKDKRGVKKHYELDRGRPLDAHFDALRAADKNNCPKRTRCWLKFQHVEDARHTMK